MKNFVEVKKAAKFLAVSEQRVRRMLAAGRLRGAKDDRNTWRVEWPLSVGSGKRGPQLRAHRSAAYIVRRAWDGRFVVWDASKV